MKIKTMFISASVVAVAMAFSPLARAQSLSQWGNAIVGTGHEIWQGTEHVFHQVADDPILIERTKSALDENPVTRDQPVIVSANNGVIVLEGRVSRQVADTAVGIARQVPGARGVDNEMLYEGAFIARNDTAEHRFGGTNSGVENPNRFDNGQNAPKSNANGGAHYGPDRGPANAPKNANNGPHNGPDNGANE